LEIIERKYDNRNTKLPKSFYTRGQVTKIAKELLGKLIFTFTNNELTGGIITETEAYAGISDKASHAYNNRRTKRTEIMYSEGGVAYVYLCYGMHNLFNFVTNKKEKPDAVLLRAIIPIEGIEIMEARMGREITIKGFTDGPGKVSKALKINVTDTGESLTGNRIWVEDRGVNIKDDNILKLPRIGVDYAEEDALLPYRFVIADEKKLL